MKRMGVLAFCLIAGSISTPAMAGDVDGNAVIGGAVGGAAGAAVGSAIGGKEGAMIGAGIGAVTGVAVATPSKERETVRVREKVVYVEEGHHDNGLHRGHYKKKHKKGHDHDD